MRIQPDAPRPRPFLVDGARLERIRLAATRRRYFAFGAIAMFAILAPLVALAVILAARCPT